MSSGTQGQCPCHSAHVFFPLMMNSALLYAAQTITECLAAKTRAQFWVRIKGAILYFIHLLSDVFLWLQDVTPFPPRCVSSGFHQRVFFFHFDGAPFHRIFPSNAYHTHHSPPASHANWFLRSFFFLLIYFFFFKCIGSLGECSHWRRELWLTPAAAARRKWARLLLASFQRQVHAGHRQQFASHLLGRAGPGNHSSLRAVRKSSGK